MSSFGPFSTATVAVLIGVVIAWRLPYHLPRDASRQQRQQTAGHVFDALLFGLVAARLGFVLRWWPDYLAAPRALLALADGGYCAWLGIAAACAFVLWRTRRQQPLRRPALLAIALGSGAWLAAQGVDEGTRELLLASVPKTEMVDAASADRLWAQRRGLFFKPVAGYGGRAAFRGDKLTRRAWDDIAGGGYVAQR
ncbi:prolipoprotein diacylglyceryl transferase family protein, partial [Dokdonella sp.]|uniref:prolipoprotein diacylglyceryl transferase family protein n=1 Tax=Dokdonella sp. TaxID=2291710 RepID=UPI0027B8EBEC